MFGLKCGGPITEEGTFTAACWSSDEHMATFTCKDIAQLALPTNKIRSV
jgi:hypothetical protein